MLRLPDPLAHPSLWHLFVFSFDEPLGDGKTVDEGGSQNPGGNESERVIEWQLEGATLCDPVG